MMPRTAAVTMSAILFAVTSTAQDHDPCKDKESNADMRDCYWKEQLRVNREADSLAHDIEIRLRKNAEDTPQQEKIVADLVLKAAKSLARSQGTWRSYRDQHCEAVMNSWTTGSGAGTAYEACMYQIGKGRLQALRSDFPKESGQP